MNSQEKLIKGALLHDIGRLCTQVKSFKKYLPVDDLHKDLLTSIKYHNIEALVADNIAEGDIAYIIVEAASIAAARENENCKNKKRSIPLNKPLKSIFSNFGDHANTIGVFNSVEMSVKNTSNYSEQEKMTAVEKAYKVLLMKIKQSLSQETLDKISCNSLLQICEDNMSAVPFSFSEVDDNDISMFMHSKLTAAIASCLKLYLDEQKITNYREAFSKKHENLRSKVSFMLISGDVSGIQDFIYTIPSQGALKSLRGRSFYLEIMLENFIDELLTQLELTRANLLYSGGGHFYLLAPATSKAKTLVAEFRKKCNQWLLSIFGTKLYLALASATCTAEDFMEFKKQRNIFAAVSRNLNKEKLNRYDQKTLALLFAVHEGEEEQGRECSVCHTTTKKLLPYDNANICPICLALFNMGGKILDEDSIFVVSKQADETAMPIFGYVDKYYLYTIPSTELASFSKPIIRIYAKNIDTGTKPEYIRLLIADKAARDQAGKIMDFEALAESSCTGKQGIKRLGVLRADVDNLGAAFISGFINRNSNNVFKYATLARYAELSRNMSMFFKLAVNKISEGRTVAVGEKRLEPFNMYGLTKDYRRKVHIVYSGGDDMFIVGAWDDLLELAVDIRKAFLEFTGGKLSFSAGLALFAPKFPISKMAEITGKLEDVAKMVPDKDSIALFGLETINNEEQYGTGCRHVYKWDEFIKEVCEGKLRYLLDKLSFGDKEKGKLNISRAALYKLMNLVKACEIDKINLARFAYTLARLEPSQKKLLPVYNDFSQQMYRWVKNNRDCKHLYTAINLLVYYLREDKEA